jgi:dienelactone hydrolase
MQRMSSRSVAARVALAATLLVSATSAAAQSTFWGSLRAGPHAIGFRVLDTIDVTRSFPSPTGTMEPRPMRLYVWYPARPGSTPRVTWGEISVESDPFSPPPADPNAFARRTYGLEMHAADTAGANARADSMAALPMAARWRARAAAGRFPIVLLTPGLPGAFAVAAELLASHGFVVVGMAERAHGTLASRDHTPNDASMEAEVEDLEFCLGAARGWQSVDARRVGVMGFSTGSLSALAFTFRSRIPSAVVALEGWEGWEPGRKIIEAYRHYDPASFRAPYLLVGKAGDEVAPAFRKTSAFFDSVRSAPRWRVAFDSATHGDFVGLSVENRRTFVRSNEYVLAFFRAQLGVTRPVEWLPAPQEVGIRVESFPTSAPTPGREEFFRLAESEPPAALAKLRELKQRDSAYVAPFTEASLSRLANLARERRPADAALLYEIVTLGYPASARASARLSDAYWNVGRREEAQTIARRVLELLDRDAAVSAEQREALRTRMQARVTP